MFTLAVTIAASALCKTVFQEKLIPEQLDWLSSAGILVCIVCFFLPLGIKTLKLHRRTLITTSILSLAGLIVLRVFLVVPLNYYGNTYNYIIGWRMSPVGVEEKIKDDGWNGGNVNLRTFLEDAGHEEIPNIFGWSYSAAETSYWLCFLGLLASVVLLTNLAEAKHG